MGTPYSGAWHVVDAQKMNPEGIVLSFSRQTENVLGSLGG